MENIAVLHRAISAGHMEEVKTLVETGADINYLNGMQGTALCNAISSKHEEICRFLIQSGCDVNILDYDGESPLLLALRKNLHQVAEILIDHPECDLNKEDNVTKSPALCFAAKHGLTEIIEKLLKKSACELSKCDPEGNTALHLAVMGKHKNAVEVLAKIKGLATKCNNAGLSSIHISVLNGDLDLLDVLYLQILETGVPSSHQSIPGLKDDNSVLSIRTRYSDDTPLHFAVWEGNSSVLMWLLKRGVNINAANNMSQTPLLLACGKNDLENAKLLLKAGADPNKLGTGLWTRTEETSPLGAAAAFDNVELAQSLIDNGADIEIKDKHGHTPLFIALLQNSDEVAWLLLNESLDKGFDITAHNFSGETLLHAVAHCTENNYELTTLLITMGCPTNIPDRLGNHPIHVAISYENSHMVQAILDEGADVNTCDAEGYSPIHVAAFVGDVEIAKMLLRYGADINEVSEQGSSPLYCAIEAEMTEVAYFFADSGCSLSCEAVLFDDSDMIYSFCDEELLIYLKTKARMPQRLESLCLESIRKVFRAKPHSFHKMAAVPLPSKIIDNLFYRGSN